MGRPAELAAPDGRGVARRLLAGFGAYGLAFLAARLVRLVTIPAIVHVLAPREYGAYATLWMAGQLVHALCDLGLGPAALRLASDAEGPGPRRALFGAAIAARLGVIVPAAACMYLARDGISRVLTGSAEHGALVAWMAASLVPATVWTAFGDQLRSEERHRTVAGLLVARTLASNGLLVLFVVFARHGVLGMVTSQVVTEYGLLAVTVWLSRDVLRERPDWAALGRMLRIGAPLGLLAVLTNLRDLDRYVVEHLASLDAVGSYDLAMRLVAPVTMANLALTMVLEPHVFRTFRSAGAGLAIATFLRGYVALFAAGGLLISLLAPEALSVIAPAAYRDAARVVPLLVFAFIAEGVMRVAGLGGDLAKRTSLWAIAAAVNVALSLSLSALLVPSLGIVGAGVGLLVGTVLAAAASYALAQRVHPLPLPVARALVVVAACAAASTLLLGGAAGPPAPLAWRLAALGPLSLAAWFASGFELRAARALLAPA